MSLIIFAKAVMSSSPVPVTRLGNEEFSKVWVVIQNFLRTFSGVEGSETNDIMIAISSQEGQV